MTEKKRLKLRKKEKKDPEEITVIDITDVYPLKDAGTISDPEDGQLDFGFLDFGSFFDSSDPDDAK